ncbi:tRNA (adenine(58)-N(1))-methyltransferase catalytic subunit TRMT61A [Cyclospora cayetanensis]|nr:tRNA (adenine(58)-N(1))-methyltransferase catalytic subunit TRMT61A [Cyclospora cayetanensis]
MGEADAVKGILPSSGCSGADIVAYKIQKQHHDQAADYPKEGDMVILYGSRDNIFSCVLKQGGVCQTRFGNFAHGDISKTPIGHKVYDKHNGKWLVVLRPTPDLHTLALRHRTQIIYHADISLILSLLHVRPGKTIIEAGTGSGSLSFSLAAALRPGGRLFTFEFHEKRWQEARTEFKLLGISDEVASFHRDVCTEGFCTQTPVAAEEGGKLPAPCSADGVLLDLPSPWLAVKYANKVLKGGGRLVTFSPCVEQLHRTLAAAQELGFQDFQAFEVLAKPWGACVSRATHEQPRKQEKKRKRDASAEARRQAESDDEAQVTQENQQPQGSSFPVLLSHFLQQPLPHSLSGSTVPAAAAGASSVAAASAAGNVSLEDALRVSSYHYQLPMKGHTGYVAVCIRPSEDESLQPLP